MTARPHNEMGFASEVASKVCVTMAGAGHGGGPPEQISATQQERTRLFLNESIEAVGSSVALASVRELTVDSIPDGRRSDTAYTLNALSARAPSVETLNRVIVKINGSRHERD